MGYLDQCRKPELVDRWRMFAVTMTTDEFAVVLGPERDGRAEMNDGSFGFVRGSRTLGWSEMV